jgi:predicted transcriptional regulator
VDTLRIEEVKDFENKWETIVDARSQTNEASAMTTFQIELDDIRMTALQTLATQTGKSQQQLVNEALDSLLDESDAVDCRGALQQLEGVWKDRQDVPDLGELRVEWDRNAWSR